MMRPILILAVTLVGCATVPPPEPTGTAAVHTMDPSIWFDGSVEKAFATAKEQNKPIFLYWGAVWCPPCNQMKNQVFSTSNFAEAIKAVIPVYLDGDTERAQEWGEKLHVSGYPTMLVLDPSGSEITRIGEFVDLEEFMSAFKSALASARPIRETVDRALSGNATEEDWNILTYASWYGVTTVDLATRLRLVKAVPQQDVTQRAVLAAKLLESASETPRTAEAARAILDDVHVLVDAIFFFDASVFAARSTLVSESKEIVSWLYPEPSPERTALIARWVKAADWLETDPAASTSDRLLAVVPQLELWQLDHPAQRVPPAMLEQVRDAVTQADHAANTAYLRHAVVSDAGQILEEAGDAAGARALLTKELKTTDTPWYYQSELADLEMKSGHEETALEWARKAHQSAKGSATRLQWIALDLKINAQAKNTKKWDRCADLWRELLDTALALPDGLSGRNGAKVHAAFEAIKAAHPDANDIKTMTPAYDQFITKCTNSMTGRQLPPDRCYKLTGTSPGTTLASALTTP